MNLSGNQSAESESMSIPQIGFITCASEKLADYFPTRQEPTLLPTELPFTPDDQLLVNRLRAEGYDVAPVCWGTPVEELSAFELLIVRSPWDYMDTEQQRQEFIAWLNTLEARRIPVENPVAVMRWLIDKHYLKYFQQAGAPAGIQIVPTDYIEPGEDFDFTETFQRLGPFILKPCLSAAARDLFHLRDLATIEALGPQIRALMEHSAFMCQPFLPEIQSEGEWSLIFLDGEYSHAVHKKPQAGGILVQAEQGGSLDFSEPAPEMIAFALKVFDRLPKAFQLVHPTQALTNTPLYLRIDIIPTAQGLMLSECEGVEPELFIRSKAESAALFCRGVARRLNPVPV